MPNEAGDIEFQVLGRHSIPWWEERIDGLLEVHRDKVELETHHQASIDQIIIELRNIFPELDLDEPAAAYQALGLVTLIKGWHDQGWPNIYWACIYALCQLADKEAE